MLSAPRLPQIPEVPMFTCKNGHEDVVKLLLNLLSRIIIDWDIRNIRSLRSLISQNCHLGKAFAILTDWR